MRYYQITPSERYTLGLLRRQGFSNAEIARITERHRSTIGREFARNCCHYDGAYRPSKAQERPTAGDRVRAGTVTSAHPSGSWSRRCCVTTSAPNRLADGYGCSRFSRSVTRRSMCGSRRIASKVATSGSTFASQYGTGSAMRPPKSVVTCRANATSPNVPPRSTPAARSGTGRWTWSSAQR